MLNKFGGYMTEKGIVESRQTALNEAMDRLHSAIAYMDNGQRSVFWSQSIEEWLKAYIESNKGINADIFPKNLTCGEGKCEVKTYRTWKYDDAPEELQRKIHEKHYYFNVEDSWWYEWVYDRLESEILPEAGIGIRNKTDKDRSPHVWGFDIDRGSHFTLHGTNLYVDDMQKLLRAALLHEIEGINFSHNNEAPQWVDETLELLCLVDNDEWRIVEEGEIDQEFEIEFGLQHYGGSSASCTVEAHFNTPEELLEYKNINLVDLIEGYIRHIENKCLSDLREDYEYQTSDEAREEAFRSNDYSFDEQGNIDH